MSATSPVVGVLIRDVDGTFQKIIVDGLLAEARKLNVSLLFFPGNEFSTEFLYAEQFNVAFALARSPRIDALLSITTTFNARQSEDAMHRFLTHYKKNIVSFGAPLPGITVVVQDHVTGLTELMQHLINVHQYKNLAFMQGPLNNIDAESRFHTFLRCLSERGLAFDPDLVVRGDFKDFDGRLAMQELLRRGKKFDALVCANDEMALAALAVAVEHGYRVPQDFAITGFDDLLSTLKIGAPLTTVHQPIAGQAVEGLRNVLRLWRKETIPAIISVPTYAVFRQTCGCLGTTKNHPTIQRDDRTPQEKILLDLTLPRGEAGAYRNHLTVLSTALLAEDGARFETELSRITQAVLQKTGDISTLQKVLIGLQYHILQPDQYTSVQMAEYTLRLQQGQIAMANALSTANAQSDFMHWSNQRSLAGFLKMGISNFDIPELVSILHKTLKRLEVPTCFVALYEYPVLYQSLYAFSPPPQSKLIFAQIAYERHIALEDTTFDTRDLIPGDLSATSTMGVFPIFQHNQHFGYILLDIMEHPKLGAEQIRDEISTTLSGALLVTELAKARDLLRADLDVAAKRNERLEILAEIDELTGLYNRRGFFERAEHNIKMAHFYPIVLIFADLDGLKQINDQFGHAEGDFAIKTAAHLMLTAFRTTDIVCRLGGDEFVILSLKCPPQEIEHIKQRVYRYFDQFNQNSDKPYDIRCSLGYFVIDKPIEDTLSGLLSKADEYLYEEKRQRKAAYQGRVVSAT